MQVNFDEHNLNNSSYHKKTIFFSIELGGLTVNTMGAVMNWGINQMTKTLNTEIPKTKSKSLNDIQLTFT